ncbi:MAG: hypothetical protein WC824_02895 [Bacteroidota bacterium]
MATTTNEVLGILTQMELKHSLTPEGAIVMGFGDLESYRDPVGDASMLTVINLSESGAHLLVSTPWLYVIRDAERAAQFAMASVLLHARLKCVKFQYDNSNGEVRACVEVLLEDATLTPLVLRRAVFGLVQIIDQIHPILTRVIEDGVIDLGPIENAASDSLSRMLEHVPPEVLADALRLADERRRASGI